MSEWIKYEGADAQIEEMLNAEHGFILISDFDVGDENSRVFKGHEFYHGAHLKDCLDSYATKQYLICNHHPLADMIIRQSQTGQPVYIRWITSDTKKLFNYSTNKPDWNIPGAEYSFTKFED